jgi:hypothetical protein
MSRDGTSAQRQVLHDSFTGNPLSPILNRHQFLESMIRPHHKFGHLASFLTPPLRLPVTCLVARRYCFCLRVIVRKLRCLIRSGPRGTHKATGETGPVTADLNRTD